MDEYDVIFYEKENGEIPIKTILDSLDVKMRARAYKYIALLAHNGSSLREPYSKYLDDNILELRIKFGTDISRILYFFFVGRKIILTNGFIKKTQKTPQREIELAKKYRLDFLKREGGKK